MLYSWYIHAVITSTKVDCFWNPDLKGNAKMTPSCTDIQNSQVLPLGKFLKIAWKHDLKIVINIYLSEITSCGTFPLKLQKKQPIFKAFWTNSRKTVKFRVLLDNRYSQYRYRNSSHSNLKVNFNSIVKRLSNTDHTILQIPNILVKNEVWF